MAALDITTRDYPPPRKHAGWRIVASSDIQRGHFCESFFKINAETSMLCGPDEFREVDKRPDTAYARLRPARAIERGDSIVPLSYGRNSSGPIVRVLAVAASPSAGDYTTAHILGG
jgi:hypothetical protein